MNWRNEGHCWSLSLDNDDGVIVLSWDLIALAR